MKFYYITDIALDDKVVHATHVDEICRNLINLGHYVVLYAPSTTKFKLPIKYHTKFIETPNKFVSVFYQIKLFFYLWEDIDNDRPDVIYSRQSQFLFMPVLLGKLFNIPIVLEVNGLLLEETKQVDKSLISRFLLSSKLFNLIEFCNVKLSSALVVVSPGIKNYLVQTYKISPDKAITIANGVDTGVFKPLSSKEAREKLNLRKGFIYIGYIGSLHSWQGLRCVIRAAQIVSKQKPEIKFLIVGDGDDADYLSSFIIENNLEQSIELRPSVAHELIPLFVNALDICISYPLKIRANAASPFKVYEYLACGRPVVVSDIGGIREEFKDAVCYAEAESPEALANIMISLADNEKDRQDMGAIGRKFIEQEGHTWSAIAQKTIGICKNAMLKNDS